MKLSLCLLVILAVCCYEANAREVCEAIAHESISFLLRSEQEVKTELEMYNATPVAVEAKLKVKRCVDQMSYKERYDIALRLVYAILECGVNGWVQKYYPEIDYIL
ncbi:prostatic steroid-binding protein C1-like [Mastomys coucha]|uniref:prostatic steroid-binding protein C1-like n=1 Tax=Mastomys coucha TaxID=35658 RepID=UPI0012627717|nr:prostatic steroid-binding protein C1-like [Mastomys coucha]